MLLNALAVGFTGISHLILSVLAVILGTLVLFVKKGTLFHKRAGYCYTLSMIGVNITAFLIYRLYGHFGMFHWMAIVSSLTLIAGFLPVYLKKPNNYISLHFNFMYWSVIGLYGAFVSETFVRMPELFFSNSIKASTFYNILGISTAVVMGIGAFFIIKNFKTWSKFDKSIISDSIDRKPNNEL